jgi:hypothetical protein
MIRIGTLVAALIAASAWPGSAPSAMGQSSPSRHAAGRSQPAVDRVILKNRTTLRGIVARLEKDGSLTMAVSREWLRKADPKLFAKRTAAEGVERRAALEQLRDRLNKESQGVPEDSRLGTFIRSERKRAERLLAKPTPLEETQFVWLDIKKREISRIRTGAAENRRIAVWAWSERFANVETRNAVDLEQQLRQKGIDPVQPFPEIWDRFPPRIQGDPEWDARMALVRYALDKPLDFQGTRDLLLPVDRSGKGQDMGALVGRVLANQANALLGDLLGEGRAAATRGALDAWLKPACREAERRKAHAFRATGVDFNLGGRQASVDSVFAVQLGRGDWEVIWSDHQAEDGTKERAAVEDTITKDPQLKSALSVLHPLGASADDQVRQAVRFGAATMAAQQAIDRRFDAFEGPLLEHLDRPPLWWQK